MKFSEQSNTHTLRIDHSVQEALGEKRSAFGSVRERNHKKIHLFCEGYVPKNPGVVEVDVSNPCQTTPDVFV